jgi:cobalt-zinc-cadmium resistance protein CzcA
MIEKVIHFSLKNKAVILLLVVALIGLGIYSIYNISISVMPDVTTNQVQVISTSRNLSTEDIEKFVTYPIELEMSNLPGVQEVRSVSKFGLSVITVVFDDDMGAYLPRQLVAEKISSASDKIPEAYGKPKLGPITTGLGEIYQYTLELKPGFEGKYSLTELRSIQDWVVRRQLAGIEGVVEVNTWGGYLKQYEVAVDPGLLRSLNLDLITVFKAIEAANENTGAAYIEKGDESYFIRGEGMLTDVAQMEKIVVGHARGTPILVRDIGEVREGFANRFGAITGNAEGEKVMGQIMMLKGKSSVDVIARVKARMAEIEPYLPEGVYINDFLERSTLIEKTTGTVIENLGLGALIVIVVLILLMGDIRSGLIIASIIPLSMLFGLAMMNLFEIDVNLMSLGAIDFGILVDGAVIIVEYVFIKLSQKRLDNRGRKVGKDEKTALVHQSSLRMMKSAFFGQIIILIVFIPIYTLSGIEGKMFRPMAQSFGFILLGAMLLCLTYVPVMADLVLKGKANEKKGLSDKIIDRIKRAYTPVINWALDHTRAVVISALSALTITVVIFVNLGGEFLPTLDEGDFVIQPVLKPGTSLSKTVEVSTEIEKILLENFPEVSQVVTRIGAAEIPTDPMSMEMTDVIVKLKPKRDWEHQVSKDELANLIKEKLSVLPGIEFEFTQPIEMRFNELISGVRSDLAIKIFGADLDTLYNKAVEARNLIEGLEGVADISVEKVTGLPQIVINYDRLAIARHGISIKDLNSALQIALAGKTAGNFYEGDRIFDVTVRLLPGHRLNIEDIDLLPVKNSNGEMVTLGTLADIQYKTGPAQITRENAHRRIVIGVNVRQRDLESLVEEIDVLLREEIDLQEGYYITFGGQYENLEKASKRLSLAAPVALVLIFILLFFTFRSFTESLLIFSSIPLATIGGVFALWIRGMPFSISAGIGFIALFGVAVLNGMVLISYFKELKEEGFANVRNRVLEGTHTRMRPVLMTAITDILGFLPMAISVSAGAEIQRPLATVVVGGLLSSTLLTLIVLPVLYFLVFERKEKKNHAK